LHYYFEVSTSHKTYLLQAENADECNEWVQFLITAITKEISGQPAIPNSTEQEEQLAPASTLSIIQNASPKNCVCADCDAEMPDWASINYTAIICIECSGIHRSLGVQTSKVRSLVLDNMDPELLQLFLKIGNEGVNSIFEHSIPSSWTKPTAKIDRATKEKFIKAKYEQKLFINPEKPLKIRKAFFSAVKRNDVLLTLQLLAQGAEIDSVNRKERTALHVSIAKGNLECVELLILNRANTLLVDSKGWTILHHAVAKGDQTVVSLILKNDTAKELIEAQDKQGNTPLDSALELKHSQITNLLMDFQDQLK